MAAPRVLTYPFPTLTRRAAEVTDPGDPAFVQRLARLHEAMRAVQDGGVGLAGSQIGWPVRVFVLRADLLGGDVSAPPVTFINPEILEQEGDQTEREGCLSFPDWFVDVTCAERVKIRFTNAVGDRVEHEFKGFAARAVQHELGHCDGRCLIQRCDKARDRKRLKAAFQGRRR